MFGTCTPGALFRTRAPELEAHLDGAFDASAESMGRLAMMLDVARRFR